MNTRDIAAEYWLSHWAQILQKKQESGLSIKNFCEQAGFAENTYYYWQRKLRETACEQLATYRSEMIMPAKVQPQSFIEMRISDLPETSSTTTSAEAPRAGMIQLEIAGVRIAADQAYPTAQLCELLKGLIAPC